DELSRYEIVKTKIALAQDKVLPGLEALAEHFCAAAADRLDGLRLDWPGKWLLVRASNTEPVVRAIAEAETAAEAQRLCDEAARVLAGV
ncbi:MAG TPA: phosphoglucosamine mutase, partial [Pirellulales bacterium]|nr:phosphoglucosamine mutase [Pirellulales bacterium]